MTGGKNCADGASSSWMTIEPLEQATQFRQDKQPGSYANPRFHLRPMQLQYRIRSRTNSVWKFCYLSHPLTRTVYRSKLLRIDPIYFLT